MLEFLILAALGVWLVLALRSCHRRGQGRRPPGKA